MEVEKEIDEDEKKKRNLAIYLAQSGGGVVGRDEGASSSSGSKEASSVVEQNAAKALFQAHNFDLDLTLEQRPAENASRSRGNGTSALETRGITLQEYLA